MKNIFNWKSILGTLVLGLIGSALWESVFSGILTFLGKALLTISTLGIESYKDNIYLNIANGFYEKGSLETLSLCLSVFFGVLFGLLLVIFIRPSNDDNSTSHVSTWLRTHKGIIKIFMLGYTVFVFGVLVLSLSKMTYVNKSIAYYHQLFNIAAPNLSVEQEEIFNARFSQIGNRADYVSIVTELRNVSTVSESVLPKEPSFIF